jgi:hypothetical protein
VYLPQILLIAHTYIPLQLLGCTQISVDTLRYQNWLDCGVSEHDTGGEETIDAGTEDLYWRIVSFWLW